MADNKTMCMTNESYNAYLAWGVSIVSTIPWLMLGASRCSPAIYMHMFVSNCMCLDELEHIYGSVILPFSLLAVAVIQVNCFDHPV